MAKLTKLVKKHFFRHQSSSCTCQHVCNILSPVGAVVSEKKILESPCNNGQWTDAGSLAYFSPAMPPTMPGSTGPWLQITGAFD